MTADEVKKVLGLVKHPREGGWYVRTWESEEFVAAACFEEGRYEGARRTSTAIYYLLEPGTFSEMHVLKSDEIFHHYLGGAVEMLQLFADGTQRAGGDWEGSGGGGAAAACGAGGGVAGVKIVSGGGVGAVGVYGESGV